jgi:hypothetical protein
VALLAVVPALAQEGIQIEAGVLVGIPFKQIIAAIVLLHDSLCLCPLRTERGSIRDGLVRWCGA